MFPRYNRFTKSALQRRTPAVNAVLAGSFILGLIGLSGCGGGSGGSSQFVVSPAPVSAASPVTVTPVASAVPVATVSSKDRSVASNFAPNYATEVVTRYLRWSSNKNLRVYVRPSVNSVSDNIPLTTISDATVRSVVRQSLDNWTTSTGGDFTFTLVDNAAQSDIEIVFVNTLLTRSNAVSSSIGITNYDFVYPDVSDKSHAYMSKAVIQVYAAQQETNLVDTTSHEIGHALGIEKHSTDMGDLMYAVSLPPATVTERDQNTLFFLYYSGIANDGRSVSRSVQNVAAESGETDCGIQ